MKSTEAEMSPPADSDLLCKELSQHIEKLTHSGDKFLEEKSLKEVKNLCKLSDSYVERAYLLIMRQLEKNHAEVRYSAFQLCSEIFQRSHVFRKLVVANLQHVLEVTVETCPDRPLPPPRSAALDLKRLAIQTIHEWNKIYGKKYKELQLAYNFLRQHKKVDFAALEMEAAAERARKQETERRINLRNEENIKKVMLEVKELESEMLASIAALENCISLLLPPPDEFFVHDGESAPCSDCSVLGHTATDVVVGASCAGPDSGCGAVPRDDSVVSSSDESEVEDREEEEIDLRRHGMFNTNYNIEIKLQPGDVNRIEVTEENLVVVENAKDHFTLINRRYLPCVTKWIVILTKSSGMPDNLKKLVDLKESLEAVVSKFLKLNLQNISQVGSDESSDSDFEDVKEKDCYEATAKAAPVPAAEVPSPVKIGRKPDPSEWNIAPKEHEKEDPTTAQSTISKLLASKVSATCGSTGQAGAENQHDNSSVCGESSGNNTSLKMDSQPSTSKTGVEERKARLLAIAPKIPYDIDLYHWEDEKLTAPTMLAVKAENSRFWSATNIDEMEEVPVPEGSASLRTRVIEFTGQFEPVTRACRAPLGNGKLCPRHDRYKCPFHGPIVPRDETGRCVDAGDEKPSEKTSDSEAPEYPDWQDPQLLAEIKASTGIDLKMPEKKKGKKKKKNPKKKSIQVLLTSKADRIQQSIVYQKKYLKTPRPRSRQVQLATFSYHLIHLLPLRSTMKRVASALDKQARKRFRDKFGDQFNYMY